MLLDAHVAHLHAGNELIDREPAGALEGVEDFEALGPADLCE
jgi:hypothetical protein